LAVILAIASIALGVGMFLYVKYLETSRSSKTDQLQRAQAAFEPALIAELTRLDDRMRAGHELLNSHTAPSLLFATLEELTLETVAFNTFKLEAAEQGSISMEMRGIARSVNAIALQADLFGQHPAITSPLFSNITRTADGLVSFDLSADLNPASLRYTTFVANAGLLNAPSDGNAFGDTIPTTETSTGAPESIPGFTQ
jgi:hypothetical protein